MRILYPFLLCISFGLCSCSQEDPESMEGAVGIAGEWQLEEFRYEGSTTVKQGETEDESRYIGTAKDIQAAFLFRELPNNTWESSGNYTIEFTTTVNGMTETELVSLSDISSNGSYSLEENALSLGYNSNKGALDVADFTVSNLTETELLLEFKVEETTEVSGFEVIHTVEGYKKFFR